MNFNAEDIDCDSVQCVVCEKEIRGAKWFARVKHGKWMVALCCPLCLDTFEAEPHPYVRRVETVELMRASQQKLPDPVV